MESALRRVLSAFHLERLRSRIGNKELLLHKWQIDPDNVLAPEIFARVLAFFLPRALGSAATVSTRWREVALKDELWHDLCMWRWADKIKPPMQEFVASWRREFVCAELDARRTEVRLEDLCRVERWQITVTDRLLGVCLQQYAIPDFPFRWDSTYVSPTLGNQPVPVQLFQEHGKTTGLQVEQDGQVFVAYAKRATDWGWVLSATYGPGRLEWKALHTPEPSPDYP